MAQHLAPFSSTLHNVSYLAPFLLIKYAGFPISDLLAATNATHLMNRIKFSNMPDCKCSFPDCSASAELEIALSANTPSSKLFAKMFVDDKHKDESKSGQMCSKFQTFFFNLFPIFVQLSNLPKNYIN